MRHLTGFHDGVDAEFEKALAVLRKSFVEMKTLPHEPDMSTLYTEAFLPTN